MKTQELEALAKGLAAGMKPRLKEIAKEQDDLLELIQDLQDRVTRLEQEQKP